MANTSTWPAPHFTASQRQQIFQTMSDGILIINNQSEIVYANPACEELLGISCAGTLNRNISCLNDNKKNKSFCRFLQNAQKDSSLSPETVLYHNGTNRKVINLSVIPSNEEIIILLEDTTFHHSLRRNERDSAMIFSGLIICICVYLSIWNLLEFTLDIHLKTSIYTMMIEAIAFILFLEILFFTSLTPKDIGIFVRPLRLIQTLLRSIPIGLIACVLLLIFNVFLHISGHAMKPYFIGGSWAGASSYIFTAIFQEFLSRGVIQTSVKTLVKVKYQKFFSILLTSLLFALMHLPFGFLFMSGAFLMSICLGIIYEKQQNIWGCALLHWCAGYLAMAMFF